MHYIRLSHSKSSVAYRTSGCVVEAVYKPVFVFSEKALLAVKHATLLKTIQLFSLFFQFD